MKKILLVGFQRSGTTFLRRLFTSHPEVKTIFHEIFLLKRYFNKQQLQSRIHFDINNFNWGEKVPYYPSARKKPIILYCNEWLNIFEKEARIIHIIRHPYDVSFSSLKTFKNPIHKSIDYYKRSVCHLFKNLEKKENCLNVKYENILINDEVMIPRLFSFCGLDPKIDYKKILLNQNKEQYRKINVDRVFSYKSENISEMKKFELDNILNKLNEIEGPEYTL